MQKIHTLWEEKQTARHNKLLQHFAPPPSLQETSPNKVHSWYRAVLMAAEEVRHINTVCQNTELQEQLI